MKNGASLLVIGALALGGVAYWQMATPHEVAETAAPSVAAAPLGGVGDPTLWPEIKSPLPASPEVEDRIKSLIAQMSVEEKVGQIMQVEIQYATPQDIRDYHVGSVLNGGGSLPGRNKYATPGEWLAMADGFYEASMDTSDGGVAIPIIWGSDAVHGHNNVIGATIFPHNIGLGAANNPGLVREIGAITALEMRATGIDWTFAPTLAVAQNDRWGRTYESYSENPDIVKAFAGEMVKGLQGEIGADNFLDVNHVVSTAKHFLGDGGTVGGDDQGNAVIPEEELVRLHAAGYETALAAGAQTVMASFSSWNGDKMHGNGYLLTDVLKERMGFDGLVVGDWNGHGQIPGCHNGSCPIAINAGLDLFMVIEDWKDLYKNTLDQVQTGVIPMARLDDAVARILRVKLRAGLFEKGMPSTRGVAGQDDIIGRPAHREVARQAVRESLVLLKNEAGVLPLKPGASVLVAGDAADNIGKQSGGWTISWQGTGNVNSDFPGATSIYAGLEAAVTEAGGSATLSSDGSYTTRPDVAIVVVGEEPYAEGQGDLETLEFEPGTKSSLALIKTFKEEGIPVVTVFLSGRAMWTNPEINASDAFVAAWLPGTEGAGVADVLVADASGAPRHDFKGRLSFSWPATPLQAKLNPHHADYTPAFALGYGLSYEAPGTVAVLDEAPEGVAAAGVASMNLYMGRPLAPWLVLISDLPSFTQLSGAYAALSNGNGTLTVVDKDIQGDALRLEVVEGGQASLLLTSGPVLDWSSFAEKGAEISFDYAVTASGDAASLGLACGDDCRLAVDLKPTFDGAVGAGWQSVTVPLSCFAEDKAAFSTISTPFGLKLEGLSDVSVANIRVSVPDGEAEATCP